MPIRYTPKSNRAVMRVTGRGRGFEFQNKNLKTPNTRFTRTREQKILEGGQHKKNAPPAYAGGARYQRFQTSLTDLLRFRL